MWSCFGLVLCSRVQQGARLQLCVARTCRFASLESSPALALSTLRLVPMRITDKFPLHRAFISLLKLRGIVEFLTSLITDATLSAVNHGLGDRAAELRAAAGGLLRGPDDPDIARVMQEGVKGQVQGSNLGLVDICVPG